MWDFPKGWVPLGLPGYLGIGDFETKRGFMKLLVFANLRSE